MDRGFDQPGIRFGADIHKVRVEQNTVRLSNPHKPGFDINGNQFIDSMTRMSVVLPNQYQHLQPGYLEKRGNALVVKDHKGNGQEVTFSPGMDGALSESEARRVYFFLNGGQEPNPRYNPNWQQDAAQVFQYVWQQASEKATASSPNRHDAQVIDAIHIGSSGRGRNRNRPAASAAQPARREALVRRELPDYRQVTAATDRGPRPSNMDSFLHVGQVVNNRDWRSVTEQAVKLGGSLFMVADGVGSTGNGRWAADTTLSTVMNQYYERVATLGRQPSKPEVMQIISDAIQTAHKKLQRNFLDTGIAGSTTIAGVLALPTAPGSKEIDLIAFNIGDVRVYDEGQKKVTQDDTPLEHSYQKGSLDTLYVVRHEFGNVINIAIGDSNTTMAPKYYELRKNVNSGGRIVITTDGVHKTEPNIHAHQIYTLAERGAQRLVSTVRGRSDDNATAMVIPLMTFA